MVEPNPVAGTVNVSGGQVNIGGDRPTFTQYNNYGPAEALDEFRRVLDEIERRLAEFPQPAVAQRQIEVIEGALMHRDPAGRPAVQHALIELAGQVTAGVTLAESISRAVQLVTDFWPF